MSRRAIASRIWTVVRLAGAIPALAFLLALTFGVPRLGRRG